MKEFYTPVLTAETGTEKKWKDLGNLEDIDFSTRESFEGFNVDENNFPINPKESIDEEGKGVLYRWGPNLAGDPVVTKKENGEEFILLIKRGNGKWAFPGGMQDKDEDLKDTVARELKEETNLDLDFSLAEDIYSGYVDDSRNTKNAWIETKALHYRLSEEEKETINPVAGDDAKDIKWAKISDIQKDDLHANHYEILQKLNKE